MEMYSWLKDKVLGGAEAERRMAIVESLGRLAESVSMSLPRLAIAWCLKNPHVSTVILGASRVEQLEENLLALRDVERMSAEVMDKIEVLTGGRPEGFDNP
jgi:aryl-alcohol dehydrogenase-like predicted oxidoreductase